MKFAKQLSLPSQIIRTNSAIQLFWAPKKHIHLKVHSNTSVREKIIAYKAGLKEQVLRKSKELGG
jgi:hypothetical protein